MVLLICVSICTGGAQEAEFAAGIEIGRITNSNLAELSGIVCSRNNPGVLWVHNDRSRDKLYAVSTNGQLLATYSLGKEVADAEDIAIGPGPLPELQYLYFGDIGDNATLRSSLRVYRAGEPAVYPYLAANPASQDFPAVEKMTFTYPDGRYDAEALLVDPLTGDLYIVTKQIGVARFYRAERSQLYDGAAVTLAFAFELDFHQVSSGDISADGQEIILRQEDFAKVWPRALSQSIADALAGEAPFVPVIGRPMEPNGEGVAFHTDRSGYYTVSEGVEPALYFFPRVSSSPPAQPQVLIPPGSTWRYSDDGSNQGTAWRDPAFSDVAWRSGPAQLGYGQDDQHTVIRYGGDKDFKHITTYFRKQFGIENSMSLGPLTLSLVFDDGVAVYLNGSEVLRRNLAANATFSDVALASGGAMENLWQTFTITNVLQAGLNTIAVEVHRRSVSEGDLSFDLQLSARLAEGALQFAGPPRRVSSAAWALDFQGPTGATVFVDGSADLKSWSNLGSASLTNGLGVFTNVPLPGAARNFYRLRRSQ